MIAAKFEARKDRGLLEMQQPVIALNLPAYVGKEDEQSVCVFLRRKQLWNCEQIKLRIMEGKPWINGEAVSFPCTGIMIRKISRKGVLANQIANF